MLFNPLFNCLFITCLFIKHSIYTIFCVCFLLSVRRRSTADSTLLEDLERNRAQTFCIRCHSFRCSGRFRCGRCGDVFLTKPAFDNEPDDEEGGPSGEGKSGTALATSSPSQNLEGTQKVTSSDKMEQDAPTTAKPQDSSPLQKDGQQQQSRKLEDLAEVAPPPGRLIVLRGICVGINLQWVKAWWSFGNSAFLL